MTNSNFPPHTPTPNSRHSGKSSAPPDLSRNQSQRSINQPAQSQDSHSRTSVNNTPNRGARYGEYLDREEWERAEYRRKLVEELHCAGLGKEMKFPTLMSMLDLGDKYLVYQANTAGAFDWLAKDMPTVCSVVSTDGHQKNGANLVEKDYVEGFKRILNKLFTFSPDGLPQGHSPTRYMYRDCQNEPLEPSKLKPDLVFSLSPAIASDMYDVHLVLEAKGRMTVTAAYDKHLGQLADYALELKTLQPMRKFVPMLFLYGRQLDLVTFVHDGYYRTKIGVVLYEDEGDREMYSGEVCNTLRDLWFILTLPVNEFGQFINSLSMPDFARLDTATQPALLTPKQIWRGSDLKNVVRIKRKVHITGRCTYLFSANYKGKNVVFKMTWLRTNRLPEGAVYKVLEDNSVPNIPEIYASGILVDDFCGYRLEYLVIEHCGTPIVDYLRGIRKNGTSDSQVADCVKTCVEDVMQTLVVALRANVLHRDISAGNIAVKGGRVYVIDWGCAKLTDKPSHAQAGYMVSRWGFDSSNVVGKESEKDPFTGTPLYMSIQMLFKVSQRGIMNDIESLFYVVLDSLSDRSQDKSSEDALGFVLHNEANLAMVRIGILGETQRYLGNFGVKSVGSSALEAVIDAMRRFLFFEGDLYIGGQLQGIYERKVDSSVTIQFMRQETLDLLIEALTQQQTAQTIQTLPNSPIDTATPDPSNMAIGSQTSPPIWPLNSEVLSASSGDSGMHLNQGDSSEPVKPAKCHLSRPKSILAQYASKQAESLDTPLQLTVKLPEKFNTAASTSDAGTSKTSAASGSRKRASDESAGYEGTEQSKKLSNKRLHK